MSGESTETCEVGYGKPPVATRFKKGQSGNPRGRERGSRNLAQLIEAELDQRITVTENGQRKTISKREAIAKQLVNKAVGGDQKAIPLLLVEARSAEADADKGPARVPWRAEEDQKVMLGLLKRLRGGGADDEGTSS